MADKSSSAKFLKPWQQVALMALLLAGVAIIQTHPLWQYLSSGIPHSYQPIPGWERVPLLPGDHLQFYYWSWLMVDNLTGPSALLTNPYEFNTFLSPGLPVFANFPFSLLYAALHPLGPVAAYNVMVLVCYLLAGLAAFLLAREVLEDSLAAIPAALVFALLPFRAAQFLSGHLYGFIAFLVPLCLWCLERGIKRRSWAWGAGAGLCLVAMSLMEGHMIYYSALFLAAYLPLRLLLLMPPAPNQEAADKPRSQALWPCLGGLALGITVHLALARTGGEAVFSARLVISGLIYLIFALACWALLSRLIPAFSNLTQGQARGLLAKAMAPWVLSPLYAVQFALDIPRLGAGLLLCLVIWSAWILLSGLWRVLRRPDLAAIPWGAAMALLAGLGAASGYMMYIKSKVFSASIAGKGRGLDEVRLFTPSLEDFLRPENIHAERLIYLGWVLMIFSALGLILLALRRGKNSGQAALWAVMGLLAGLLCLGPTLAEAPLYAFLYKYLPFFNFPRVPGRLILFAALMLSLLAGWSLRELLRPIQGKAGRMALAGGLIVLLGLDFLPQARVGICLLPQTPALAQGVKDNLPIGPRAEKRLLGLPIWPGDSHQSSAYEYLITLTRAKAVNGYSPVVPRAYVEQIYRPLESLNYGVVSPAALETLAKNKVGLISFFDSEEIYPRKISPFPPALARQRLMASQAINPLGQAGNVFFLGVDEKAGPGPANLEITSPVTSLWEAEWLKHGTGQLVDDPQASGWGQMFAAQATPMGPLGPRFAHRRGNVVSCRTGRDRPGFMSFGPYKAFPAGSYVARFRLRRGPGGLPGRVEISADSGKRILASRRLDPEVLPQDGRWHDVSLAFAIDRLTGLEFRTRFLGQADLDLDVVLVDFANQPKSRRSFAAWELWRQTGELTPDKRAPGGLAVAARAGYHPAQYLMHGPQHTLEPGRYEARFVLAAGPAKAKPEALVAELVVATDQGRAPLAHALVHGRDLANDYQEISLPFIVKRRCEIGFRVLFRQGGDMLLAGVNLRPLQ